MRNLLSISFLAVAVAATPAWATAYMFGYSEYTGQQKLILSDSSLNTYTLDIGVSVLFPVSGANQGWWSPTEINYSNNDNYAVGVLGSLLVNNFFTFF